MKILPFSTTRFIHSDIRPLIGQLWIAQGHCGFHMCMNYKQTEILQYYHPEKCITSITHGMQMNVLVNFQVCQLSLNQTHEKKSNK